MQVIQMKDYQALELVQQNYQTFIVFMDKESGDLKASFQYLREIKSGFVYLCDQTDSEDSDEEEVDQKKSDKSRAEKQSNSAENQVEDTATKTQELGHFG